MDCPSLLIFEPLPHDFPSLPATLAFSTLSRYYLCSPFDIPAHNLYIANCRFSSIPTSFSKKNMNYRIVKILQVAVLCMVAAGLPIPDDSLDTRALENADGLLAIADRDIIRAKMETIVARDIDGRAPSGSNVIDAPGDLVNRGVRDAAWHRERATAIEYGLFEEAHP
ncbi:hypothetical protein BX600DRAFT_226780 [Xylariales sp. PMI_506]|nr:hypothetical protein BX600DRAFT_226780 [Xylariales sp. PMI_506]